MRHFIMQRIVLVGIAFVGLCTAALVAKGGAKNAPSLSFNTCTNPTSVTGDLAAFRNTTAGNYGASCSLVATSSPLKIMASCSIANYNAANGGHGPGGSCPGVRFTCTSTDRAIIDAVSTLQSSSKLTLGFSSTCASGGTCTCTSITVDNSSNDGVLTF